MSPPARTGGGTLTGQTWNADGTLHTRTDGSLSAQAFAYDWAKREASATSPIGTGSVAYVYNLDGTLASKSLPNGESEAVAYDAARRPTSITLSGGGTLTQGYDRAGNVTSEGRTLGPAGSGDALYGTQAFRYDALGRLTGSSGLAGSSAAATYQYDLDGNRTQRAQGSVTTSYAYDRTGELVSQSDGTLTAFAYDGWGDMTAKAESGSAVTAMAWDVAGRLVRPARARRRRRSRPTPSAARGGGP